MEYNLLSAFYGFLNTYLQFVQYQTNQRTLIISYSNYI
jgi:hypothetical protein